MQRRYTFFYLTMLCHTTFLFCHLRAQGVEIQVMEWIGQDEISDANLREVNRVLEYTLDYYEVALEGTQTIRIRIILKPMATTTLAWGRFEPWPHTQLSSVQWWPSPLLIQVLDTDVLQPYEPHATVSINSTIINNGEFDFSLSPTISVNKNGFLSTILHEFGHALGFVNLLRNDGIWYNYSDYQYIDRHSDNLSFLEADPFFLPLALLNQAERSVALTSDELYWSGSHVSTAGTFLLNDPAIHWFSSYAQVYAPYWSPPLLLHNQASHWDPSHSPRQLMAPSNLGNLNKLGLLLPAFVDMGWTTNCVTVLPPAVPIETTSSKSETLQSVDITNTQAVNTTVTLSITGPHASEFTAENVPGNLTLQPWQTATIPVSGAPVSWGYKTATLLAQYSTGISQVIKVKLDMYSIGVDTDEDGISDYDETRTLPGGPNPFDAQEEDSTGDNGEMTGDGVDDGRNDFDGDGMVNMDEFIFGYVPLNPDMFGVRTPQDTDGDGLLDRDEAGDASHTFDPYFGDSSGDFFYDDPDEIPDGQNDYDGDGYTNAFEFRWGSDPFVWDGHVQLTACSGPTILLGILSILWLGSVFLARMSRSGQAEDTP
ncbi:MAG TPA: hypothetical protein PLC40_02765 [Candidatus Hydrogenedentes bacterium]|nr:MAG: hypothetical protein BWY09_00904 [Candidatus Hydrogenedentes bacterium ADurb.Bin179]HOH28573.1 hypothetical protein [Candidatus Hydrogenedentota bacterium]